MSVLFLTTIFPIVKVRLQTIMIISVYFPNLLPVRVILRNALNIAAILLKDSIYSIRCMTLFWKF